MTNSIRVLINGASGKMGQEAVKAISNESDFEIVGKLGRKDDLAKALLETKAHVAVDLTSAETCYKNTKTIIEHNVHPVIGTSGLSAEQLAELQQLCADKKLGGIIAPNFSIGSILMMLFAKQAAIYFPECEIIEMHHAQKKDAPSGTALKTAEYMQVGNTKSDATCVETLKGVRGGVHHNIPIHSIRLPGLVAHQEIIFGGHHESFTMRHDVFNRGAYMQVLVLSIRKVLHLNELVYGLENILISGL